MKKGLNTPDGVLVRIKHKILLGLGVDSVNLKILIDRFVNKTIASSSNDRQRAKVNLYNEFTNTKLTIKGFFKLLKVLNIKEVEFKVTVLTKRDIATTVTEKIFLFTEQENEDE